MPEAKLAVGVNTAVRVRPVPLMALKVPPVTDKSPALPSHAKLARGASENVKVMLAVSPALSAVTSDVMMTLGAVVSTKKAGLLATAEDVMVAALPAASFKLAPFKCRAFSAMATPSVSVWPLTMAVLNTNALEPEPETYVACTVLLPKVNSRVGEPAVMFNTITSLKVIVASSVSPALSKDTVASLGLRMAPMALVSNTFVKLGATVSRLNEGDAPAAPKLPAASS